MKNKKGFTLIELLAVIVILGLLMAIAIPSVTKYITESRKKTVVSTIGNYITAMVNEVNDLTYTFTGNNTIYAVPIECIALERGGTNPFGAWHQASNAYWAYVLVQYDDETSSYTYGYTFKDSAGYGLYPTSQSKLNEQGKQIQTGLSLSRPITGKTSKLTSNSNWIGFEINNDTIVKVLEAESESNIGDGINTCTLQQKGNNYSDVEDEKNSVGGSLMSRNDEYAFWNFENSERKIKSITFENHINIPNAAEETNIWDVSANGDGSVMSYVLKDNNNLNYYHLFIQSEKKIFAPKDSSFLLFNFRNVDQIQNIEYFDTSMVTNMSYMFSNCGADSEKFALDLGNNFSTSNVVDMGRMFAATGYNSTNFTLNLGEKFDTSKVTNMWEMFAETGYNSTIFSLDLGGKFNTINVKNMSSMFIYTGVSSPVFTLNLGNNFDTRNVTDMSSMFSVTGTANKHFILHLGDKFNTKNVVNMNSMFYSTGSSSTIFTLDLGNNFDTSSVTDMSSMFQSTGWDSTNFVLNLGNKFNTSNVEDMSNMFYGTAYKTNSFLLDCSNWSVDNVREYQSFNYYNENKITPPKWKN